MINFLILTMNCLWLAGMSHLIKNNELLRKYKLGVEITLATAAVCGINFLFGILLLFNQMESTPNDLLNHMIGQKTIMARFIIFTSFFGINFIFGAHQVWRKLVRNF